LDFEKKIIELVNSAIQSYNRNELLIAEDYANQAYDLSIKFQSKNQEKTAELLNMIAMFLFHRKQFNKSIIYFNKSISHLIQLGKHSLTPVNYNGLAQVFQEKGDYENALNYFKKTVIIAEPHEDTYLPTYVFHLARIQKIVKNFEQAYKTYQKSIETAQAKIKAENKEEDKFYEQIIYYCYNDLSEIELAKNELLQGKQYHQQALQVLENSQSEISTFFEAYKRFEILAKMLVHQKEYKQAIELFYQAKADIIEEYKGFEVGKDLANIIHQIGECHTALNHHKKALQTYQNAIKSVCNDFQSESVNDLPNIELIYNKRSAIASLSFKANSWLQLYHNEKKQDYLLKAFQTYQLINKLLPITRRDYVEENSKFQLADETKGIYEKAIDTCLKLHQLTNDEQYLHTAFQFSESSKAIVLQEKLQADFALQGMEQSVQDQDMDFKSKIAFYQTSINTNKATNGSEQQLKDWQDKLWQCKEAYDNFQQKIEKENPDYYSVKYAKHQATVNEIQKDLTEDSALIEYFTGTNNLYIFIITKDSFSTRKADMSEKELLVNVQSFKNLIHQFSKRWSIKDYEKFKTLAYKLYQSLLQPALKDLGQPVKRLIIIPDGLLYHIPFEVLLTTNTSNFPSAYYHTKNLDYICKQYALCYYYSASLLLNTSYTESPVYPQVFTGFAPEFEDLNKNKDELKKINELINGEILPGKAANLKSFKEKATVSKILHLATHAVCNDEHSKLSSIQFSDKQSLYISDIENMKIEAELTILSACETGYGFVQSGDGAMSLARSFFIAGCPSLVASQWRANDESTAKIILYFYKYLKNGNRKDVALQKAKLQYCEEAGIRGSHPFYWACFQQYGNRRALF